MGRSRGLEPPTPGTTNQCSNQLSYDRHGNASGPPSPAFRQAPAPLRVAQARRQPLQPEVPAHHGVQPVDANHEVGNAVAVGVAADIGVAVYLLITQLARGTGEGTGADESERLIA